MYNLVNVCVFCAQFFDPDFPDGIAYPVKVPSTAAAAKTFITNDSNKHNASPEKGISVNMNTVPSESKALVPYYDTRYLANPIEVGDVLYRPSTMDSRQRARRAVEIAHAFEKKPHLSIAEAKQSPPKN